MKTKALIALDVPVGEPVRQAREFIRNYFAAGNPGSEPMDLNSSGFEEVRGVYKDIHSVMAAQGDLVEVPGRFEPKLVKMCPAGERAEDQLTNR